VTVEIKCFELGELATNAYVVADAHESCILIDPPRGCADALEYIVKKKLQLRAIVLTHGHFDHIMGIPEVQERFPDTPVWIHRDDTPYLSKPFLNASVLLGQKFSYEGPVKELDEGTQTIGGFEFTVLHVPGHTPGGIALVIDNVCICGDSLFAGSIGRYDFAGGNGDLLIRKIKEKLLTLPDTTVLYPGHGGRTTVGREKRMNPFFSS
jgi:glyoxylase-like metal-dependent hydrolase (beta-lactamase superfamily II)